MNSISEVTRRNIADEVNLLPLRWTGRFDDIAFLSRLYNLRDLPSNDYRYRNAEDDIRQHTVNNRDWDSGWYFDDDRFDLIHVEDKVFLRFLCETVHPVVRDDEFDAKWLVKIYNKHLKHDGWKLCISSRISNKPVYSARSRKGVEIRLEKSKDSEDILSEPYLKEVFDKIESRFNNEDFEGAITIARTFVEAVLKEIEIRLKGNSSDYKGDLPRQYRQVSRLLKLDDERKDLDERFKEVVRGLASVINGLAPLRNKMGDSHPRERKPARHHAKVIVNASKTVTTFLVDSFNYQKKKGLG